MTCEGRSRRKLRSTRGEYWLLASCSATTVIEKTRAVSVMIAVTISDRIERAVPGVPPNASHETVSRSLWSIASVPAARAITPATATAGRNQRLPRSRSATAESFTFTRGRYPCAGGDEPEHRQRSGPARRWRRARPGAA